MRSESCRRGIGDQHGKHETVIEVPEKTLASVERANAGSQGSRPERIRFPMAPQGQGTAAAKTAHGLPRPARTAHPFCLNLRTCGRLAERFIWEIRERGKPKRYSAHTYATFDEARVAGKAALAALIVEWRRADVPDRHPVGRA